MPTETEAEPLGWCVVATVTAETTEGPDGLEIRTGVRHFAAGTRVWVLPPPDGRHADRLLTVGHHRGRGHRLVRVPVSRRHLTGFRVRMIYSRAVLQTIGRPDGSARRPRLWNSRAEAQQWADGWNACRGRHPAPPQPRGSMTG